MLITSRSSFSGKSIKQSARARCRCLPETRDSTFPSGVHSLTPLNLLKLLKHAHAKWPFDVQTKEHEMTSVQMKRQACDHPPESFGVPWCMKGIEMNPIASHRPTQPKGVFERHLLTDVDTASRISKWEEA